MENNVDKNNAGIESYDGGDAYYEGTDKDYEDFLKQVDDSAVSAGTTGVENSGAVTPGETINIRGVIDMVRKKAGEGWSTAKKLGGEMREQINDYIAAANGRSAEKRAETEKPEVKKEEAEIPGGVSEADKRNPDIEAAAQNVSSSISGTARAAKSYVKSASDAAREKINEMSDKLGEVSSIGADIDKISANIEAVVSKLDAVSSKLNDIEVKQIENKNNYDRSVNDIRVSMTGLMGEVSEVNQSTSSIAKLSDAVFDLKNTQQTTKKAIADLDERVISVRRKITAGVTILSILSVITIVLEIINLLS